MEGQIQLGMAYEQFQRGKKEQLNESINKALTQYQSKLLNETNWSAPEELKTLMDAIESNEKKIIEQAKSELEIDDENERRPNAPPRKAKKKKKKSKSSSSSRNLREISRMSYNSS